MLGIAQPISATHASGPSSNRILNYQLRLTDQNGIPVPDGTQNLKISFYDAATSGTRLYTDCGTTVTPVARKVVFVNGFGTVLIGDTSADASHNCSDSSAPNAIPSTLFDSTALYVGITVSTDAEMTPRKRVAATGYALNSNKLNNLDTSAIGGVGAFVPVTDSNGLLTLTGTPSVSSAVITANPAAPAVGALLLALENNGTSVFSTDAQGNTVIAGSGANLTVGGNLTVQGTGTNTIGGSIVPSADNAYDLGTTSSRFHTLHLGPGSLVVHNDNTNTQKVTLDFSGANAARFATDATSTLQLTTGANTGINITTVGRVGIGTNAPTDVFQVSSVSGTKIDTFFGQGSGGTGFGATDTLFKIVTSNSQGGFVGYAQEPNYVGGASGAADFIVTRGVSSPDPTLNYGDIAITLTPSGKFGLNTNNPQAEFEISSYGTGFSGASGLTKGIFQVDAATYTDTATAASGTAPAFAFAALQQPTLSAANTGVTTTDAATLYIANSPANGTNLTISRPWSVWVAAGNSRFDGNVAIGTTSPIDQLHVQGKVPSVNVGSASTDLAPFDVTIQGRYAYVVNQTSNTLQIFDVSASAPSLMGSVATATSPRVVVVQGRYAYVANDGGSKGFQVIDVSNPAAPSVVSTVTTGASNSQFLGVQGKYLYVDNGGLGIYDISNPASPTLTGTGVGGQNGRGLKIQGRYAYEVQNALNTLLIWDVQNPAAPSLVSTTTVGTTPRSIYIVGKYAYIVHATSNDLKIFDISNPASPSLLSTTAVGSGATSIFVQDRVAYVVNSTANTMQLMDVSNPSAPASLGTVTTNTSPQATYVQGRFAYVVNSSTDSLQIFDVGGAYIQQVQTGGIEAATVAIRNGLSVGGDANINGGLTVGSSLLVNGNFSTGGGATFGGTILPSTDNTYDLGSTTLRWKSLHVGPGSVVVHNDTTNTQKVTLDFSGANAARLSTDSSSSLQLSSNSTSGVNIDTAGRVGVGTTVPLAALAVQSHASFSGTGTVTTSGTTVTGSGTTFDTQLHVNDAIVVGGQTRVVSAIASGTSMTIATAFNPDISSASGFSYVEPAVKATDTVGNIISASLGGRVDFKGTMIGLGGASISGLTAPNTLSGVAMGTTGATTWTYSVTALNANGGESANGSARTISNGNATLTSSNFNRITWAASPGAYEYNIYRSTAGGTPATTGRIGTVAASSLQFDDTGLATVGGSSTGDTSGYVGIGTTSPAAKLQIVGGSVLVDDLQGYASKNSGGNIAKFAVLDASNNVILGDLNNANGIALGVSSVFNISGQALNSVGIGQSVPTEKLEVNGNVRLGAGPSTPTTLTDNPLTAGATTANVVSTTGYPLIGYIVIDSEVMHYSNITSTSFLNLSRGNLGTSAASHTVGTSVNNLLLTVSASSANPRFAILGDGGVGVGTFTPTAKFDVVGKTISTDADNSISAIHGDGTFTKNDTNTRTFSVASFTPIFNFGASNTSTTVNVFNIDTTNTSTTGLTTNLIKASFGGSQKFLVDSTGQLTLSGNIVTPDPLIIGGGSHGTPNTSTTIIGQAAVANGASSVAVGKNSSAGTAVTGSFATAVGFNAVGSASGSTAIGANSTALGLGTAVGQGATISGSSSTIVGYGTSAASDDVVIGEGASASGTNSVVIGLGATTTTQGIAIGLNANAIANSIALGVSATSTAVNQIVIGSSGVPINDLYLGRGVTNATVQNVTIRPTAASGTDVAGGNITINGGQSTGAAAGGAVIIQTSPAAVASGSSLNAFAERLRITSAGLVGIGTTTPAASLDVVGQTISTNADLTVSSAHFNGSFTKNDTNARTFFVNSITPIFNFGASNTSTTVNVLNIDTTNTSTTGLTANLIKASFGGIQKLLVDSNGAITTAGSQTFSTSAAFIDFASSTNDNTFAWKIPQKATNGACSSGAPEGIQIEDSSGTQRGHLCIDGPTSATPNKLRFYAEQFNSTATDLAEMYETRPEDKLEAGDLVALDSTGGLLVKKTSVSYDTKLVGVISDDPGLALTGIDEATAHGDTKNGRFVALKGRVPVKVSREGGAIQVGDALVPSSTPGVAMKADQAGTIIGYALEPFDSATNGAILTFVNAGWWQGPDSNDSATTIGNISQLAITDDVNLNTHGITNASFIRGMNGLWEITVDGTVIAKRVQTDTLETKQIQVMQTDDLQTVGEGVILTGNTSATIENPLIFANSKLFITFYTNIEGVWWISSREDGRFEISLSRPATTDVHFEYLIINVNDQRTTPPPTTLPITVPEPAVKDPTPAPSDPTPTPPPTTPPPPPTPSPAPAPAPSPTPPTPAPTPTPSTPPITPPPDTTAEPPSS